MSWGGVGAGFGRGGISINIACDPGEQPSFFRVPALLIELIDSIDASASIDWIDQLIRMMRLIRMIRLTHLCRKVSGPCCSYI